MTRYDLDGRAAIVTGASSGLGEEFAHALAECGCSVVLAARRGDRIEELATTLRERHGVRAHAVQTDVSREQDVLRLFERTTAELGKSGIRVNAIAPGFFPTAMSIGAMSDETMPSPTPLA